MQAEPAPLGAGHSGGLVKGDPECSEHCPCRDPEHPMHEAEDCGTEGWYDGNEFICTLPEGHGGKHVDRWEGGEW